MKVNRGWKRRVSKESRNFFKSLFISFGLFGTLLVFFSTFIFINKLNSVMEVSLKNSQQKTITQISYLFDNLHTQMIHGVKESSYNIFFYKDLMYSYSLTQRQILDGLNRLDNLKLSNPLIQSIYLYNGQMNFFLTTSSGLEDAENFYDREVLNAMKNYNKTYIDYYWPRIGKFTFSSSSNTIIERPTLTLILGTTPADNTPIKGALIVNLDLDEISSVLSGGITDSENGIFIFNQNGFFISSSGIYDEMKMNEIYQLVRQAGKEQGSIGKVNNSLITYKYNYRLGWYFIESMPLDGIHERIMTLWNTIILAMFVLLLLVIILSYYGARRMYRPIKKLLLYVSSKGKNNKTPILNKNEFSIIYDNYGEILMENYTLVDKLDELNNDYRIELFRSMMVENDLLTSKAAFNTLYSDFSANGFGLFIFQIDDYYLGCQKIEREVFQKSRIKIRNMILSFLEDHELLVDTTSYNMVCITTGNPSLAVERMKKLHRELLNISSLSLTLGYSLNYEKEKNNLSQHYNNALDKVGYKFNTGFGKVQEEQNIESTLNVVPKEKIDLFFKYLKQGDKEACEKTLTLLCNQLRAVNYKNYLQFQTIFSYRFLLYFEKNNTNPLVVLINKIQYKPEILETIDIFQDFYLHVIQYFFDTNIGDNKKGILHFNRIEECVRNHFREVDFCVNKVSEMTNLSPNYTRKIYSKYSDKSLSSRIKEYRLEEACRLLSESDQSIKDIVDEIGFTNYNSFITLFRKYYSVTPVLYRQKHQIEK